MLRNLKVIVPFHNEECDRLAGRLDSGGEIAALPLELRRFEVAVGSDGKARATDLLGNN